MAENEIYTVPCGCGYEIVFDKKPGAPGTVKCPECNAVVVYDPEKPAKPKKQPAPDAQA